MSRRIAPIVLAALMLAGCTTGTTTLAEPTASSTPAPASSSGLTPQQKAGVRANAGIPADPDPATKAAYIRDLDAIDRDIVHGKADKAVDRGLNQCGSIKEIKDRAKLVDLTNQRFTSPTHPQGHGTATAARILDVVHDRLCPTY